MTFSTNTDSGVSFFRQPWLLVVCYSLLGICFPAAVTQFSMVSAGVAEIIGCDIKTVLLADSLRAVCLVGALFLSGLVHRRLGLKKSLCVGLLFQIGPQFLVPLAVSLKSVPLLFLFKGMQGFNAVAFPLFLSTITMVVPPHQTGLATAVFNGSFVAGAGIGAWISGLAVSAVGWQFSFYLVGALCLLFAIPALALTGEQIIPRPSARAEDPLSARGNAGVKGKPGVLLNPKSWLLVLVLLANTWVAQAITVDMPVYGHYNGFDVRQTGSLMLAVSIVTVLSSVLGGGVSDCFALRSRRPLKARSMILAAGYLFSAAAAVFFVSVRQDSFILFVGGACAMMFGVSWAAGVFWSLPPLIYEREELVSGSAFCSGASNIVNPLSPFVVGVMLGSAGYWPAAWLSCAVSSLVSLAACFFIFGNEAPRQTNTLVEGPD